MVSSEGMARDLVKIYVAASVLEASMIRSRLAREGISCLIPGEDLEDPSDGPLEANAILVPEEERDRALKAMEDVWDFFEPPAGGGNEGDELGDA